MKFKMKTVIVFSFALLYFFISILMMAHLITTRLYFHGAPTQEVDYGQTILGVSLASSMVTVYFALFVQLSNRRSATIFACLHIGFIISILTSFAVIYFFRNADPIPEKVQDYTNQYFKAHGKPPPFFDRLQNLMNGYCCGAMSYLEYIDQSRIQDMFDVPRSCCFGQLKHNVECGKNNWKYLYTFLASLMPEILTVLEKHYDYLDDLETVVKNVAMANSRNFLDNNYKMMIDDRVASLTSNSSSDSYNQILRRISNEYPNLNQNQMNELVSRSMFDEAQMQITNLIRQFEDPWSMTFVPIGCWTLINEMRTSRWQGFKQLKEIKIKIRFMVEGALAMACLYAVSILIFVVIFYLINVLNLCGPKSPNLPKPNPNVEHSNVNVNDVFNVSPEQNDHKLTETKADETDTEDENESEAEAVQLLSNSIQKTRDQNRRKRNEINAISNQRMSSNTKLKPKSEVENRHNDNNYVTDVTEVSDVSSTDDDELKKLLSNT